MKTIEGDRCVWDMLWSPLTCSDASGPPPRVNPGRTSDWWCGRQNLRYKRKEPTEKRKLPNVEDPRRTFFRKDPSLDKIYNGSTYTEIGVRTYY